MGEEVILTQEDVNAIAKTFPLEPLFNRVYITLNKLEADGELILSDNVLSESQYIVAGEVQWRDKVVGPGQKVIIDIEKMMVPVKRESTNTYETVMQVKIDPVEINGNVFAIIDDRIIKSIDNR